MRRGFTLLEMMVVVGVLGVVAALGVVSATELVHAAKDRSAVDGIADQVRELRDRAQSSGMSVILTDKGNKVGIKLRAEPCEQRGPCATPTTSMTVASDHAPLSITTFSSGKIKNACINPDGRSFVQSATCEFVPGELTLTTKGGNGAGGCSACVALREGGEVDAIAETSVSRCTRDADCGGGRCETVSERCVPAEGIERPGDAGRMFGETR
jgi:prepilin-type N-terminal cleavage/methylation domain-containing protein